MEAEDYLKLANAFGILIQLCILFAIVSALTEFWDYTKLFLILIIVNNIFWLYSKICYKIGEEDIEDKVKEI